MANRIKYVTIILQSKELKKLLIHRATELQIPLEWVVKEVAERLPKEDIKWSHVRDGYFNETGGYRMEERWLIEICSILGVDIRIQVVIKSPDRYDPVAVLKSLKEKYQPQREKILDKHGIKVRKKTRTATRVKRSDK